MPWDPPGTASARVRLGGNCASRRGRPQLHSLAADELHEQAVVEVVVHLRVVVPVFGSGRAGVRSAASPSSLLVSVAVCRATGEEGGTGVCRLDGRGGRRHRREASSSRESEAEAHRRRHARGAEPGA